MMLAPYTYIYCQILHEFCNSLEDHFTWIELFAGKAEATRMMRYGGHRCAKLDLKYNVAPVDKQNFMNILEPSGFLLLGAC